MYNQLKGLITERSRKQKLKNAFDHALKTEQEFKDFQTEVMLIAPKEMPKVMQNKYANATKSASNPASPER